MPEEISDLERVLREAPAEDNDVLVRRLAAAYPDNAVRTKRTVFEISHAIVENYLRNGLEGNVYDKGLKLHNAYAKDVLKQAHRGSQVVPIPGSALNALGVHGSLMFSGGVWQRVAQEYAKREFRKLEPETPFPSEKHIEHPYEENIGWIANEGIKYLENVHNRSPDVESEPNFPIKKLKPQLEHLAQRFEFRERALRAKNEHDAGKKSQTDYVRALVSTIDNSNQYGHQRLREDMFPLLQALKLTPKELGIVGDFLGGEIMEYLAPEGTYTPPVKDQLGLEI